MAHLDAAYRIAIAIMLREAEDAGKPFAGPRHVAIHQVGKHSVGGNGAVFHSDKYATASGQSFDEFVTGYLETKSMR